MRLMPTITQKCIYVTYDITSLYSFAGNGAHALRFGGKKEMRPVLWQGKNFLEFLTGRAFLRKEIGLILEARSLYN
jgi:hypothetical protein